jgi:hypothetical protein
VPRRFWLALGACLLLVGCNSAAAPSAAPSASASITPVPINSPQPSTSPKPSPSNSTEPTELAVDAVPIPPDTYARVVTNDLRVRSKPGVSADSKKLEPLLQDGVRVVVLDGPVQASGYDWYLVQPTITSDTVDPYPFGWVAAADQDGEPWLKPDAGECPALPTTLEQLGEMNQVGSSFAEITCFSGEEITFPARLVTPSEWCGLGDWPAVEPAWMGECTTAPNYLVGLDDDEGGASLHPTWSPEVDLSFAPEVESPPEAWPTVEVTGLFDHPDARTCRASGESTDTKALDRARMILGCRMQFVVTSLRELEG